MAIKIRGNPDHRVSGAQRSRRDGGRRPSAIVRCTGPRVSLVDDQAFGGFFPSFLGAVGLGRCR